MIQNNNEPSDILDKAQKAAEAYAADFLGSIHPYIRNAYLAGITEGVRLAAAIHEEVVSAKRI